MWLALGDQNPCLAPGSVDCRSGGGRGVHALHHFTAVHIFFGRVTRCGRWAYSPRGTRGKALLKQTSRPTQVWGDKYRLPLFRRGCHWETKGPRPCKSQRTAPTGSLSCHLHRGNRVPVSYTGIWQTPLMKAGRLGGHWNC